LSHTVVIPETTENTALWLKLRKTDALRDPNSVTERAYPTTTVLEHEPAPRRNRHRTLRARTYGAVPVHFAESLFFIVQLR